MKKKKYYYHQNAVFLFFMLGIILGGVSMMVFEIISIVNCEAQNSYLIVTFNDLYIPTNRCSFSLFEIKNVIPSQNFIMKFCQEHGYTSGWISSVTCNGITCYKEVNEYTKYDCFGLDGEKK